MRATFITLLLLVAASAAAQSRQALEGRYFRIDTTAIEGNVDINIDVSTYLRNNEYFSDYVEGYTLPGYTLQPTIAYFPTKNTSIEAGLRIMQYGGDDDKAHVFGVVRAQVLFTPDLRLTLGVLDGYASHDLPESIIDNEKNLNGRPETGVQLIYNNKKNIYAEAWVDWQHFIYHGDTVPERLMGGVGINYALLTDRNRFFLEIPIRLTANHVGGQINDYEEPMQSLSNGVAGLRLSRWSDGAVKEWQLDVRQLFFHVMAGKELYPATNGTAFNIEYYLRIKYFDATFGYFGGHDFYATNGNPTFMNISNYKNYYQKHRSIATAELNFNYQPSKAFRLYVGGKAYYDTDASQCDYYYGLGIIYNGRKNIYRRR